MLLLSSNFSGITQVVLAFAVGVGVAALSANFFVETSISKGIGFIFAGCFLMIVDLFIRLRNDDDESFFTKIFDEDYGGVVLFPAWIYGPVLIAGGVVVCTSPN